MSKKVENEIPPSGRNDGLPTGKGLISSKAANQSPSFPNIKHVISSEARNLISQ